MFVLAVYRGCRLRYIIPSRSYYVLHKNTTFDLRCKSISKIANINRIMYYEINCGNVRFRDLTAHNIKPIIAYTQIPVWLQSIWWPLTICLNVIRRWRSVVLGFENENESYYQRKIENNNGYFILETENGSLQSFCICYLRTPYGVFTKGICLL